MAKLYFRYGAMGSSKTANAIMVSYNYAERGKRALILKPRLDSRDGETVVASRSGLTAPCEYVENLPKIDVESYDCLIIDEAQFMTKSQVEYLLSVVDEKNIPVICYGLRADFRNELFEGSKYLLAWADSIEEIKTVCWCGRKATCNTRVIKGRAVKEGEQIFLGGSESYVALCRRHWKSGELGDGIVRFVDGDRAEFWDLFMTADAEEQAVNKYLSRSDLYAIYENGRPASEMLLYRRDDGNLEIKSLATIESARCRGFAGRLIEFAKTAAAPDYEKLYVGTDESMMSYYEKFGFRYDYTDNNFFVDNYENPVIDNGKLLTDMVYLSLDPNKKED